MLCIGRMPRFGRRAFTVSWSLCRVILSSPSRQGLPRSCRVHPSWRDGGMVWQHCARAIPCGCLSDPSTDPPSTGTFGPPEQFAGKPTETVRFAPS